MPDHHRRNPLYGVSDEAVAARVPDRELLRQFQAVEHLPDADKQVVKTLLDAFLIKRPDREHHPAG